MNSLAEHYNKIAQHFRLNERDYAAAAYYYSKVIDIEPQFEFAQYRRALCYISLKQYERAIDDLTESMSFSFSAEKLRWRANIRIRAGHYQEAIEDCTEAINLGEAIEYCYKMRAKALSKLGEIERAHHDFWMSKYEESQFISEF